MSTELIDAALLQFLRENAERDPSEVALANDVPEGIDAKFAAQQLKGRQRMGKKLPSWVAEERVVYPQSLSLEQCSSELAARYKASLVEAGAKGCDLTGGFGVDARFLAERFDRYNYIERNSELEAIVAWNFRVFGMDGRVTTTCADGTAFLAECAENGYDFLFLDPARRDGRSLKVSALEECEPDVVGLWERLCTVSQMVMVKASPGLDISRALALLPGLNEVHVVAVGNECKELLLVARRGDENASGGVRIHCVNIGATMEERETFSYGLEEERGLESSVGPARRYLYEPNAAVMKGGGFKSVSAQLGIPALNPRTRLYTSDTILEDFPGRVFEIVGRGSLNVKDARRLFPEGKANVISRNSGMSAEEMRKKLKLKDGGELFAVGAAVSGVGRALFACRMLKNAF